MHGRILVSLRQGIVHCVEPQRPHTMATVVHEVVGSCSGVEGVREDRGWQGLRDAQTRFRILDVGRNTNG